MTRQGWTLTDGRWEWLHDGWALMWWEHWPRSLHVQAPYSRWDVDVEEEGLRTFGEERGSWQAVAVSVLIPWPVIREILAWQEVAGG